MAPNFEKKSCSHLMDEWKTFIFLTGLFSLAMCAMLQTLDPYEPTYQDRLSIPGIMICPQSDSLCTIFTTTNTQSWDGHTNALDTLLGPYSDSIHLANNDNCTPNQYFLQDNNGDVRNNPKESCQIKQTILENCSGTADCTYLYAEDNPCVIIKMNWIIEFKPGIDTNPAYLSCTGMNDDSKKVGSIAYYPAGGIFNKIYFPYYGKITQVIYSQLLVVIKFLKPTLNTMMNVECKVVASDVATYDDQDKFVGRSFFSLQVSMSQ
uniref:Sodium/potassium-transporting ATPase subunit beta n=1 Tax=Erpetoichthys calabaricus TaxID=27687 RepID=A0A8C4TL44_ERPCA